MPMQETVTLSEDFTPPRVKWPSTSVISPFRVPFTITEAPMTGSPFSSMTVPFMSMLWADENCSAAKNINKNTKIFRFIR